MTTSLAFFRLACYLAAGGLCALAIVPRGCVARGFFRFGTGLYAALWAVGLLVRPDLLAGGRGALAAVAGGELPGAGGAAILLFAVAAVLAGAQGLLVGWIGTGLGRGLIKAAALLGAAGVVIDGLLQIPPAASALPAFFGPAAALSSALLLGSVITAMTLGHWYLVMPKLTPEPLMRLTWLYALSVFARGALIVSAVVGLYLYGGRAFDHFLEGAGLLVWPRLLFGLVAPSVLALMALPTVRRRDTQPATGMLYVACVLVLVGEGLGLYLGALTGIPV